MASTSARSIALNQNHLKTNGDALELLNDPWVGIIPYSFRPAWAVSLATPADHYVVPLSVQGGAIAVGLQTAQSGATYCIPLAGSTGTHSTETAKDDHGRYSNSVSLRRPNDGSASSGARIAARDSGGQMRPVFGLLQCANGTADGAAATNTNRQISFVLENSSGTLEAVSVSGAIEFEWLLAVAFFDYPMELV